MPTPTRTINVSSNGTLSSSEVTMSDVTVNNQSTKRINANPPVKLKVVGASAIRFTSGPAGQASLPSTAGGNTVTVTDSGAVSGTWTFELEVGGTWHDPQIYNNGTGG